MTNPKVEVLPIEQGATPDLQNVNKHTQRGRGLHENSMRKRGAGRSIFSAGKGADVPVVMGGNQTLEIAAQLGMEVINVHTTGNQIVNVVRDDIAPGSPEFYAMGIEDNEVGRLSYNPDIDILAAVMADPAMQALKDEDKMLAGIVEGMGLKTAEPVDAEPQIDRAAELAEKWQTKSGQLWKLGEHRLLIGDCTVRENVERLMGGERAQGCFTSPPYADRREYDESTGFKPISPDIYVEWWKGVQSAVSETLLENGSFFVNIKPHCDDGQRVLYVFDLVLSMVRNWGWMLIDELCWIRQSMPNGTSYRFRNGFEPVYHFSKDTPFGNFSEMRQVASEMTKPKRYRKSGSGSGLHNFDYSPDEGALPDNVIFVNTGEVNIGTTSHPATFPVRLPEFFIAGFSSKNDIWFEPFGGSGTTIIAAHNLNRRCYAMEISEKYGAVILERYFTATGITPELME